MLLLAGDIGGTKSLLGVFDAGARRPRPLAIRSFTTRDYDGLDAIVAEFLRDDAVPGGSIESACFGLAGPVLGHRARLTNVPWTVDALELAAHFHIPRVDLLNDLESAAYGVTVLEPSEVHVLREGEPATTGSVALIAAGTGLGEALLHNVNGRFLPLPLEGGHADFAARNEREIRLLRWLIERHGRATVEDVVSGRGLINIHQVVHTSRCSVVDDVTSPGAAAAISKAALDRRCAGCVESLEMFVEAYGAEAGNLALRMVTTGGCFIGGGIAPKSLPALTDGRFLRAFSAKPPLADLLAKMSVKIVLNDQLGLIGASVFAAVTPTRD